MVISRHVTGKIRRYRYIVETLLALIFFGVPWLTFQGAPLMRLDVPARKFYLLGNFYIPQEGYFLHLFLAVMGLSLFFFTALIGRVWCGWACPQTVFTDFFDLMGRLILGKKYGKKDPPKIRLAILHLVWILFSLISAFHFMAYFNEPTAMLANIAAMQFPQGSSYQYFLLFLAVLLYLDMTLVREQFCKFACPYARFQTVLMDDHSYNVTYDHKRGEPRRQKKVKIGDCTACNMCLVVCPTGIDIRDGLNVGCIACGKCVDACTIQMAKENKKTLIDYNSMARIETGQKIQWIRSRTLIYGVILTIISIFALFLLNTRVPLYIRVIPDRNIQPMVIPGKQVRNFYNLRMINISYEDQNLSFKIDKQDFKGKINLRVGNGKDNIQLAKNSEEKVRLIVDMDNLPRDQKLGKDFKVELVVFDKDDPSFRKTETLPLTLPDDPAMN